VSAMSEPEFRDEPRSWPALAVAGLRRHATVLYALGAVVFGLFLLLGVAVLVHIEVTSVPVIARAETASDVEYSADVFLPGLYLNLTLYAVAFATCVHGLVNSWGEPDG